MMKYIPIILRIIGVVLILVGLIAALFIPVGIGHVKLRRWALTLNQPYIWFWLVAGFLL